MARIVYNKVLGGWYIVTGPYDTPLGGRFDSRAEAQAHLQRQAQARDERSHLHPSHGGKRYRVTLVSGGRTFRYVVRADSESDAIHAALQEGRRTGATKHAVTSMRAVRTED